VPHIFARPVLAIASLALAASLTGCAVNVTSDPKADESTGPGATTSTTPSQRPNTTPPGPDADTTSSDTDHGDADSDESDSKESQPSGGAQKLIDLGGVLRDGVIVLGSNIEVYNGDCYGADLRLEAAKGTYNFTSDCGDVTIGADGITFNGSNVDKLSVLNSRATVFSHTIETFGTLQGKNNTVVWYSGANLPNPGDPSNTFSGPA
jgi:hypothetical protein